MRCSKDVVEEELKCSDHFLQRDFRVNAMRWVWRGNGCVAAKRSLSCEIEPHFGCRVIASSYIRGWTRMVWVKRQKLRYTAWKVFVSMLLWLIRKGAIGRLRRCFVNEFQQEIYCIWAEPEIKDKCHEVKEVDVLRGWDSKLSVWVEKADSVCVCHEDWVRLRHEYSEIAGWTNVDYPWII